MISFTLTGVEILEQLHSSIISDPIRLLMRENLIEKCHTLATETVTQSVGPETEAINKTDIKMLNELVNYAVYYLKQWGFD